MSIERVLLPEGELLNVLEDVGRLEWRKCRPRYPEVRIKGKIQVFDQSAHPPSISFRFEHENEAVIDALRRAVESWEGRVSWAMEGHERERLHGTNWRICPRRTNEVIDLALRLTLTPDQYLAKFEPDLGPVAYDDLEGLTEHIRQALHKQFETDHAGLHE